MKPRLEKVLTAEKLSFACNTYHLRLFDCPYHIHPEYELVYVEKSEGRRIVGDCVEPFGPGDVVLIGANVPHMYLNEQQPSSPVDFALAYAIQFREHALGDGFFSLPELAGIRRLLLLSQRGLAFEEPLRSELIAQMQKIFAAPPAWRLIGLLEILQRIVENPAFRFLASAEFQPGMSRVDADRINSVIHFVTKRLDQEIYLEEAAQLVSLTKESFSRFFRRVSRKTFTEFINELRISKACNLLVQTDETIIGIAECCGFNNLSNFNKRFLSICGMRPSEYRRSMTALVGQSQSAHKEQGPDPNDRFAPAED